MARKRALVADLLCGAGGSSTGCAQALHELGLEMELVCVNHWGIAIDTHKKNHPEARHYCQDIATVRPHIIVPEGYLDLLMASPTCTHHSVARGGKPTSDQQRSDPWHIITWMTELLVKRLIIENVWEFIGWGPVDPRTGKPIKERKGEYFKLWINAIRGLGYEPEWRKLNAADFGEATTRQRFILMARNDKRLISWPVPTHHKREAGGNLELIPHLKPWRPAREIIDWSLTGRSIFGRPAPLAPKTLARILAGATKFNWPRPYRVLIAAELERSLRYSIAKAWTFRHNKTTKIRSRARKKLHEYVGWLRHHATIDQPESYDGRKARAMVVTLRNNADGRSADLPLPTVAAGGTHIALAEAVMLANRTNNVAKDPSQDPLPCMTTASGGGIGIAQPVVVNMKGKSTASDVDEPVPTMTSHAQHLGVAEPIVINGRRNNKAKGVSTDPIPALDTKGGVWLAEPFVMGTGAGAPRATKEPLPTITTGGAGTEGRPGCARPMLVEPFVLSRHAEGAPRSIEDPTPTQVAKHSQVLISPYYGSGSGETCTSAEDPVPTVTTKARLGMVVPVTHSRGGNAARDAEQPIPTCTTAKGGDFAVVMPVTHAGGNDRVLDANRDPIPTVTGANRGELAFIAAQFGEREGQAPRVHAVDQPTPGICATGHINLVEAAPKYDVLFRMFEPHELAPAMGFDGYEFSGNKTQQIKQIGNAVSVKKMKACVSALMADAAPRRRTRERDNVAIIVSDEMVEAGLASRVDPGARVA